MFPVEPITPCRAWRQSAPVEQFPHRLADIVKRRFRDLRPGDEDHVPPWRHGFVTHYLFQSPLDAIPHHGVADPAADQESKPAMLQRVREGPENKQLVRPPFALALSRAKLRPFSQAPLSLRHPDRRDQTVSLVRPFKRRRFSTMRPSRVLMRCWNPCTRKRRRIFGWKVCFGTFLLPQAGLL